MTQPRDVLNHIVSAFPSAICVSTCGYISRDLYSLGDRPENFYLVGAMGSALPVTLGAALSRPTRRFVAIDGDGSVLMNPGAMLMVGDACPTNVIHLVLDNGVHESTGQQRTVPSDVPALMTTAGYAAVYTVRSLDRLSSATFAHKGPLGIYIPVAARQGPISPRIKIAPSVLLDRTRTLLASP